MKMVRCRTFFHLIRIRSLSKLCLLLTIILGWSNSSLQKCSVSEGKHLRQSLFFNKFVGLKAWDWCLPVNFAKYLRTPFFIEQLWWLLLDEDIFHLKSQVQHTGLFYSTFVLMSLTNLKLINYRLLNPLNN